jgi:hypothetical protein
VRRVHLIEIHEKSWCPASLRDAATDYLQLTATLGSLYANLAPILSRALDRAGTRRIVDLCSGGGGPWFRLHARLEEDGAVDVLLTDKFPNDSAMRRARELIPGGMEFSATPVDASDVPADLQGFRTLFAAFHHFRPEEARAVLEDAVRARQGIGVFEPLARSAASMSGMLFAPLLSMLITPFIRPFRLSRLFWAWLVPALPLIVFFDGVVSCWRSYTQSELRELTAPFDGYTWEIGEVGVRGVPVPVTYLIGLPREA